jgi:hypothetical protein
LLLRPAGLLQRELCQTNRVIRAVLTDDGITAAG